ncbi:MAG: XRE family transcriptional regulator [Desulfobacteraceae bacterium]|nr:MAG: XRE family transcriptional regulator [Desulfobacteraceae bacterium]
MIKYNFKSLLADKEFREDRKIKYEEISEATGISRQTLSKIAGVRGYKTNTENIEKLCVFFNCTPDQLMTILPDPAEK